jgi:threonine dehydratase
VFFKCETLQKTGSFKFRGAIYALSCINPDRLISGVVCHSSGNHGQAVAAAAEVFGVPATVVVPNDTPKVKCDAIEG